MEHKIKYTIKLDNNRNFPWSISKGRYAVKGFAFINNRLLANEHLALYMEEAWHNGTFDKDLNRLNGNFSGILIFEDEIILVSDKIRSFPLLFSTDGYIISDTQEVFLGELKNKKAINRLNEIEILALGYVSGRETLLNNVLSVGAGEYVRLQRGNQISYSKYHYYIYPKIYTKNWDNKSRQCFYDKAQSALENGFKRILNTIPKDSKIVIPLSGGYDSRLIACLCKKFRCENVVCYTYGRKTSFEVEISRKVAETLNFDWHFVEYDAVNFTETLKGVNFNQFAQFTENLNSIPHVQEFLALTRLKETGIIHSGDIVIPGFCGDVFGGSKIPKEVYCWRVRRFNARNLANVIYDHFYDLNTPYISDKKNLLDKLRTQIDNNAYTPDNLESFIDIYENWCIDNRLAKFIINSVRVYEYFNLGWRLPLWDDKYARLWYEMSWKIKSQEFLNQFMFERYFINFNVDIKKSQRKHSNILSHIKNYVISIIGNQNKRRISKIVNKNKGTDFNCFEETALNISKDITPIHILPNIKTQSINAMVSAMIIINYSKNDYKDV